MPSSLKLILSGILMMVAAGMPFSVADEIETDLASLCGALDKAFQKRAWGKNPCGSLSWKFEATSVQGRPLIYLVFGPENSKNTTLILSMVHGDEITPLYLGFQISQWAEENMSRYPDARLVIAPFINPDGFLGYPKSRTNAHGVDCNRNFSTRDWQKEALVQWKKRFHSDKRRFPGYKPDSEPETLFQKGLIEKFKPHKIISIHSPLNVLDYDGPDHVKLFRFSEEYVEKCQELREKLNAKSTGFYPGSLGNYTGKDLGIPTITLELPTANHTKAKEYWQKFKKGLELAISHEIPPRSAK